MFFTNYLYLCNKTGDSPYKVATDLGFNRSLVGKWKKGSIPQGASLAKIAEHFNVSVDYLMGTEQKEKPTGISAGELSDEAIELAKKFDAAAPELKKVVEAALEASTPIKPETIPVDVVCAVDGSNQVIYQPVYRIAGKVLPGESNNGCENYHSCKECDDCRLRAAASLLPNGNPQK